MANLERFVSAQQDLWYEGGPEGPPQEPYTTVQDNSPNVESTEKAHFTEDTGMKALMEIINSLRKEVQELKANVDNKQAVTTNPAVAAGWRQGGLAQGDLVQGGVRPVPFMDRKLMTKLEKYSGSDLTKFPAWLEEFRAYMEFQDSRFLDVLDKIEEARETIGPQESLNIALAADIVSVKEDIDKNLTAYLKAFTTGDALKLITKVGKDKIYEGYRQLCEAGRSRRPEHIAALRTRVQSPKQFVPLSNLISTIMDWEKEVEYCEKVHKSIEKPFNLDDEDRRLYLINMCPREFGDHILRESARFPTYAAVRSEIVEHIARSKRPARGALNALSEEIAPEQNELVANMNACEEIDDEERENTLNHSNILVMSTS